MPISGCSTYFNFVLGQRIGTNESQYFELRTIYQKRSPGEEQREKIGGMAHESGWVYTQSLSISRFKGNKQIVIV